MHRYKSRPARVRLMRTVAALIGATMLAACNPDSILEVRDPDIILPEDIVSPAGAAAARLGALRKLNEATSGDESFFLYGGLLADEWRSGDTFAERDETDQRTVQRPNAQIDEGWRKLHQARVAAQLAIRAFELFPPEDGWHVAEMYMTQAYAEILLAEHFCSGVPLSTVENGTAVYAAGSTTEEVLASAIANLEAALTHVLPLTDADATAGDSLVTHGAQILMGRALVDLGSYTEVAAAVAGVPSDYEYITEHSPNTETNIVWSLNVSGRRYTVSNSEGGNGLPFVTAADPRVPTCKGNDAACRAIGVTRSKAFDTTTDLFVQLLWTTDVADFVVISGREARLLEAEALLKGGQYPAALTILNALRNDAGITTPLTAAATEEEQVRQLFSERAFWLFSTGHRLGDMRRMIRSVADGGYGLAEDAVFPTGAFFKGGEYGDDVNFPIPQSEDNNPLFATSANPGGCINRNP